MKNAAGTIQTLRTQIDSLTNTVIEQVAEYNMDARRLTAGVRNGSIRGAVKLCMECDLDDMRAEIKSNEARVAQLQLALDAITATISIAA